MQNPPRNGTHGGWASARARLQPRSVSGTEVPRGLKSALHKLALLFLLLLSPLALALNPDLDVTQYSHKAWKNRDGFANGEIHSITQTPDGYLWLGTAFGLLRFDGIKAVPWQPPNDPSNKPQHLPSNTIWSTLAARDGALWIGTSNGLASWKDGGLTSYPELAGLIVGRIIQDREGSIWAGAYAAPKGKLCEIQKAGVRCSGEDGRFGLGVFGLHEDGKGTLWVGTPNGVWRWKPGPPEFYPLSEQIQGMADDADGSLLIAMPGGVRRLAGGKVQMVYPFPAAMRGYSTNILRDRDGGLWVEIHGVGIAHLHQGRIDLFSQSDGLTNDGIDDLFEDREGNIWVATYGGLDRFRELPVVTYSTRQGLSSFPSAVVLGASDGSIWFATRNGLNRLEGGQVTVYRPRRAAVNAEVREVIVSGMPDRGFDSLLQDSRGRIWTFGEKAGYFEHDSFTSVAAPGGIVDGVAEDRMGNLWIAEHSLGLVRWSPQNQTQQISWAALGHQDFARALVLDPSQDGLWLGFYNGGLASFRDGQIRASYSAADGLGEGRVNQLRFDAEGALWAATEGGLSRFKDGRFATLTSKNRLPCDAVHWTAEDDTQSVWLMMPCGLVRVARSELDSALLASAPPVRAGSSGTLHPTVFDTSDGVVLTSDAFGYTPHVAKSADGKLWFWNEDGIGSVDPLHLPFNKLPPPVHIEAVTINGKEASPAEGLKLSHNSNDLEINYTALSLTNPDRVRFRYKLEGRDVDWRDAGTDRKASYDSLRPKNYRFRVMASNNDGVWNEAGATWDFAILPAFYQTLWFQALCVVAGAGFLWLLYRLRLHQMTQRLNLRMEERVNERTRIARDLHDTLLQSFQGVLLKFHAVTYMLPERPDAQARLEGVIAQAREAITEGRDAVQGLRSSTLVNNDLAQAITVFAQDQTGAVFRVQVEGASRELAPLVRDEAYRIAIESLRNAFRHSEAKNIEVEIRYNPRQLQLRIRDDGKGIDEKVLREGGRAGHHGLPGMQERAKLVGGKLTLWSKPGAGTEIELTIPASIAYAKPAA